MRVFVDTSAIFAIIDQNDEHHELAAQLWTKSLNEDYDLITTNYIILETYALVQRRLGMQLTKVCHEQIVPMLHIEWVSEKVHQNNVSAMLTANRRQLSLVDCVSFAVCRELNIRHVFCFDPHFQEQGFRMLSLRLHG